jgi:hypothetical protein
VTAVRYHDDEYTVHGLEQPWVWTDDTPADDPEAGTWSAYGILICIASAAGVAIPVGIALAYVFDKILNVVCAVDPSFSYCIPG